MSVNKKKAIQELFKRSNKPQFNIEEACFPAQVKFIKDPAKRKIAVTSRRAGKTSSCARDIFNTAIHEQGDVLYITLSRVSAKRIIWRELLNLLEQYNIQAKIDQQELFIKLPNGNIIFVSGAKDAVEIEKFRGLGLRKVYIDEAQSFRGYISDLIEEIIDPCLLDYDGTLVLIGTPGPLKTGFFYECWTNPEWKQHKWTMQDNIFLKQKSGKTSEEIIEDICKRRGVTREDPSIQREYYGNWEDDRDALVFKYNPLINRYANPEDDLQYVIGVDIGYNDADAIAVLGYNQKTQNCFLMEEIITEKQAITPLAAQIRNLELKYRPLKIVMDAGALGKKIQEEIRLRHGIHTEAAEKHRKLEFITLMNDDLRLGRIKTLEGSRFEEDSYKVEWDRSNPEKIKISDRYHTDIGDAFLYAWRECMHYFKELVPVYHSVNSNEYMNELEERLMAEAESLNNQNDIEPSYDLNKDIDDGFFDY